MALGRAKLGSLYLGSYSTDNPAILAAKTVAIAIATTTVVGQSSAQAHKFNPASDTAGYSGALGSFQLGANHLGGGQVVRGRNWSIVAGFTVAKAITINIVATAKIVQIIDLSLGTPGASFIRAGSLSFSWELNRPATCSGDLVYPGDATSYYVPREGHQVRIKDFDDTTVLFHGKIHSTSVHLIGQPGARRAAIYFTALGWERETFRRYAVKTYSSQDLDVIVADLVTTYLAGYGITATGLPAGVAVDGEVVFSYQRIDDCFNELKRRTGYHWRINESRNVEFYSPGTALAGPVTIADANSNAIEHEPGIVVEKSLENYRNKQILTYVRVTIARTGDAIKGDGSKRVFSLPYDIHSKPTAITVGGSPIAATDIGIKDLDTGKKWYWNQGSPDLTQDDAETVVADGVEVVVDYTGEYSEVRAVTDAAEVADRASIEGDTDGTWENVAGDGVALTSAATADDYAQALIDRESPPAQSVTFATRTDLVASIPRVGQYAPITVPELALSGNYFQTSIKATVPDLPAANGFVRYEITASSNEPQEALDQVFKQASADSRNLVNTPSSGV